MIGTAPSILHALYHGGLRTMVYLVEMDDMKKPDASTLGTAPMICPQLESLI